MMPNFWSECFPAPLMATGRGAPLPLNEQPSRGKAGSCIGRGQHDLVQRRLIRIGHPLVV